MLNTDYLYASTMLFAKDAVYTATGRPGFFDTDTGFEQ
jgi:hypothetical protein